MKIRLVRVPAFLKRFEQNIPAYIRQLARVIQENYDDTENAVNNNNGNAESRCQSWVSRNG